MAALTALLLTLGTATAQEAVAPEGFDAQLVYMATGVFDPDDPDYEAPDGNVWHREIMGRSEAEMDANRQEALAFFEQRFGFNGETDENIEFMPFMFDPRNEYRAYSITGRDVPPEGWVIRDGGWMATVKSPDGIDLGGEFEGTHVPEGAFFVFGDYNIDVPDGEPIIIHYQSGSAILPSEEGIAFRCELTHPEWGEGLAQGVMTEPQPLDDGRVQANVRNILTFPGLGNAQ